MSPLEWIAVIAAGVAAAPIVCMLVVAVVATAAQILCELLAPVRWIIDLVDPPRWINADEVLARGGLDDDLSSTEKIAADANPGERSPRPGAPSLPQVRRSGRSSC